MVVENGKLGVRAEPVSLSCRHNVESKHNSLSGLKNHGQTHDTPSRRALANECRQIFERII